MVLLQIRFRGFNLSGNLFCQLFTCADIVKGEFYGLLAASYQHAQQVFIAHALS